jgi:phosphoribosyl-dephospho-CoA transferase
MEWINFMQSFGWALKQCFTALFQATPLGRFCGPDFDMFYLIIDTIHSSRKDSARSFRDCSTMHFFPV